MLGRGPPGMLGRAGAILGPGGWEGRPGGPDEASLETVVLVAPETALVVAVDAPMDGAVEDAEILVVTLWGGDSRNCYILLLLMIDLAKKQGR